MKLPKALLQFSLILVLVAVVIISTLVLLGPVFGNTFSTINSSLSCVDCAAPTPPSSLASSQLPVQDQLTLIDQALSQSMRSSFAYNSPSRMNLGDTATIELLINPSTSTEQLGKQITESGTVNTGTLDITPSMKAELIAQNPDAFVIRPIPEDPIQLISSTNTTNWEWFVTAKKGGPQALDLIIYRLVQYQGQGYWREVEAYKANINVNVTLAQHIESVDWKWIGGILIAALLIPAFWRWVDQRKSKADRKKDHR
jgi:hypothetical protein